jgi:hypothetical protein
LVHKYLLIYNLFFKDGAYQKEINLLTEEAVQELDSLFLQFGTQSDKEKVKKLLPQLGKKLHALLEQFQLLGKEQVYFLLL